VRIDFGVVQLNKNYYINRYIEKTIYDYGANVGIYVFEPRVPDFIAYGQYLDFPDLVLNLIAAVEKVVAFPFDDYWKDLGRPDDYEQAAEDFCCTQDLLPQEGEKDGMAHSLIRY
jgi:NDP-sugar pyrophosphorylase family protein